MTVSAKRIGKGGGNMRFGELSAVEAWIIKVYRKSMKTQYGKILLDSVRITESMMNEANQSPDCQVIDFQSAQGKHEIHET